MRILMLAHRIPYPPHTGDKVRAFHVARHLAHGHDLTLACLADDSSDLGGETHHNWEASLGQLDRVIEAVRAEAAADVRFAP
jgi:hypothetical protein